jgi:hypothetical protein
MVWTGGGALARHAAVAAATAAAPPPLAVAGQRWIGKWTHRAALHGRPHSSESRRHPAWRGWCSPGLLPLLKVRGERLLEDDGWIAAEVPHPRPLEAVRGGSGGGERPFDGDCAAVSEISSFPDPLYWRLVREVPPSGRCPPDH